MDNLAYHKGSCRIYTAIFRQEGYCSQFEIFIQHEADDWHEECLLCGYERDVPNLVTMNALGEKLYTDVQISTGN